MSVPHLLLVDDSAAALALARSVLAQHYLLSTATDGVEALERVRQILPAAVLLDLSMPRMDGEEVLARMRADPALATIPVIVVSSEQDRGEATLTNGAAAFVRKPYHKEELLITVGRVLAAVLARSRQGTVAVLPVVVAHHELGLDLGVVRTVLSMTEALPLPTELAYVTEYFALYGEAVCIVDLAARLGVAHGEPLIERKLIVLEGAAPTIALCVDRVREPVELPLATVAHLPAADADPGADVADAIRTTPDGILPVIDPHALIAPALRGQLAALIASATNANVDDGDVL